MKTFKYTACGLLIFLAIVYLLPSVLLQTPYFRDKISDKVIVYLEKKLGTEVSVESVEFGLFNRLILKNVFMKDQSGDTLFIAKRIGAGFEFLPLFKKQFHFHSIQLFSFTLNLSRETDNSPLNLQYIIDAFQKENTDNNNTFDVRIKSLNLRLGNFTYRVKDKMPKPGLFHPEDLSFHAISAKITVRNWTGNELDARLDKLSLTEKSGLQMKRLSFDLLVDSLKAEITKFKLELPSSQIQIAAARLDYKNRENVLDMPFQISVEPSAIYAEDFSAMLPAISAYRDKIVVEGSFSGTVNDFTCTGLSIHQNRDFLFQTFARIQNVRTANPDSIYVDAHVDKLTCKIPFIQEIIHIWEEKTSPFPEEMQNLGDLFFNGKIEGYLNNLSLQGLFNSDLGDLDINISLGKEQSRFLKGKISSPGFNLKPLILNNDWGMAAFKIDLNATLNVSGQASGILDADIQSLEYKGYAYENINLNGEFTPSGLKGSLNIENPNGKLVAQGSFLSDDAQSKFNFSASASNIRLDKLNLTKKYPNSSLSFTLESQLSGNEIDNLEGNIQLHDLSFSMEKSDYTLANFEIRANRQDTIRNIRLHSDIINGELKGVYSIKHLIPELKQMLSNYLPSLSPEKPYSQEKKENNFSFDFTVHNSENLTSILKLPLTFYKPTRIMGSYNNRLNELKINANIPSFKAAGAVFEESRLELKNREKDVQLELNSLLLQKAGKINVNALFTAGNNSVHSLVSWNNSTRNRHEGKLEFTTSFSGNGQNLATYTGLKHSQIICNDSIWTLYPTSIRTHSGTIEIKDLKAQNGNQMIEIDGNISRNETEQVMINLNQVNLSYIFQTLNIKALDFGGIATGKVFAKDVYKTRQLTTNLDVKDFAFNRTLFGHLLLNGSWDNQAQGVKMTGNVSKNDTTNVRIDGMIYPVKEELSILFDAQNADAAFLRKYLDKVIQNISGKITGPIRLFGHLNHPTIEGTFDVKNGGFAVKYLNAYYTFSDKVVCTPDQIVISNLILYDENNNKAFASGYVKHVLLDDFNFSVNLDFEKFLVFNADKASNPIFYGTAYGTGSATIRGTEESVNINVSLQNTENSKMILNFIEETDVAEYNFIRFVDKEKKSTASVQPQFFPIISDKPAFNSPNTKTDIHVSLSLGITPNATIELLTNSLSGDKINAYGNGHLDIQYSSSAPLKVMGKYTIEKGKYNFSLQQLLIRNFDIKEGSSVTFNGNPYAAEVDINAAYMVSANLGDLDERLYQLSARNNVPVNCILLLNGPLSHPNISFDLDLPSSTSELTRQVKSYIRTDDMMSRQFLYLLALGRFYTSPEYIRSDSRLNNDLSFLTSTLSSQLSNLLGGLSDNFQIGTTFHQAYEGERSSTEVEVLLSSTLLNNRLTINGNFGYINNPVINNGQNNPLQNSNNAPIVGDLDLEYKLTPAGNIRLKAFNHYNYRNYYSITPELTQGIGILLRKDFNHLYDLLGIKKKD